MTKAKTKREIATATSGLSRKQLERLGFQAAIMAGDYDVAPLIYADWLADNGTEKDAKTIRRWLASDQMDKIALEVRCELISKVSPLLQSQTAFRAGWYDTGDGDGFITAVRKHGYIPTLCCDKCYQARLGLYLEALGVEVFWIGKQKKQED